MPEDDALGLVSVLVSDVRDGGGDARPTRDGLAEDNADGFVYEGADPGATIIAFPGARRPRPAVYGPFNQEGSLDGLLISIGGADQTVHVQLQNSDIKYVGIETDRDTARRLAKHMYEPIRVFGIGRWLRDAEGQWILKKVRLQSFVVLQAEDLRKAAARLRRIEGSGWSDLDDPLAVLKDLRGGGSTH